MRRFADAIGSYAIAAFAAVALLSLAFVVFFIVREALPLFSTVSLSDFLLGTRWMPVDFGNGTSFGIFNFIVATIAVSFLALAFALLVGVGTAVFLASAESHLIRSFAYPFVDLLAGVPSVV